MDLFMGMLILGGCHSSATPFLRASSECLATFSNLEMQHSPKIFCIFLQKVLAKKHCDVTTFVENVDGFLNYYSRMTERCEDFICTLALETSCEGSARICRSMNLKTSGDSIIRLLTKRYVAQPEVPCGSIIGVDDFAFKKRHTYGTIIVDEATHKPVAILDGRDGKTLKEWLSKNKHVKAVTRDRASAYSAAIKVSQNSEP